MPVITTAEWQARKGEEGSLHEICGGRKGRQRKHLQLARESKRKVAWRWKFRPTAFTRSQMTDRSIFIRTITTAGSDAIHHYNMDNLGEISKLLVSWIVLLLLAKNASDMHQQRIGIAATSFFQCDFLHFKIFSHRNYVQQTFPRLFHNRYIGLLEYLRESCPLFWRSIASNLGPDKMDKYPDKWTCRRTSSFQHVTYPADKW